jgi:AcrR family transcriptional regulator
MKRPVPHASTRVTLSRELIVEAAMRLAAGSARPLTLSALGQELGADPTALYRHYRNRDELRLDLGDQLYALVNQRVRPTDGDWRTQLTTWALAVRAIDLEHPALAIEVAPRFTGGPHEQQGVDELLACLGAIGFAPQEAGRQVRALAELVLGHIGLTATLLTLPLELQEHDVTIGLRVYPAPDQGPTTSSLVARRIATAREDEDAVFDLLLRNHPDGLAARLPTTRPDPTLTAEGGAR